MSRATAEFQSFFIFVLGRHAEIQFLRSKFGRHNAEFKVVLSFGPFPYMRVIYRLPSIRLNYRRWLSIPTHTYVNFEH